MLVTGFFVLLYFIRFEVVLHALLYKFIFVYFCIDGMYCPYTLHTIS